MGSRPIMAEWGENEAFHQMGLQRWKYHHLSNEVF